MGNIFDQKTNTKKVIVNKILFPILIMLIIMRCKFFSKVSCLRQIVTHICLLCIYIYERVCNVILMKVFSNFT